ncbi:RES domain-containing protein [Mycolicibacter longobardus]|uniref:RES domain-containing protein n=1 Tax=Mycolicibacter longobardus TaxID=1108812 RepID=A0A1X1YP10_9MYCO|nr:RES domain-containing protein [Mycolicibacter longobardus]MCV7384239.1 RES domain-containing protein [Mycolicibacter longobardus]ORW12741.1 hypothetical protein AWC16_06130 [Mycolicibacter longobardus]
MNSLAQIQTSSGPLRYHQISGTRVYRVGYSADPWSWTPWEYADHGRFNGRWDDPDGIWRTLYVGSSALACHLEVLARFRADPQLVNELAEIDDDEQYPTAAAGTISPNWCERRILGEAKISGAFALPAHQLTLPTLRHRFLPLARSLGLDDVDAAAVRDSRPRALTQAISAWIYTLSTAEGAPLTGIQFQSRHGDALRLWAIYERAGAVDSPAAITNRLRQSPVRRDDPVLTQAMQIHRLSWSAV